MRISAILLITVVNIIRSLSKLLHLVVPLHHMKIISKRRCQAKMNRALENCTQHKWSL